MSARPLRSSTLALILAGGIFLVPVPPARAAGSNLRDLGGITREIREHGIWDAFAHLLRRVFAASGGGMDPNGDD